MPELDMQINPFMVDALIELIEAIMGNLESVLPGKELIPEEDEYLSSYWVRSLREEQEKDCTALMHLLRDRRFGRSPVQVKERDAEAILRSCSALRLKIQDSLLRDIPEYSLETGELQVKALAPETQRGYACYLFLASVQALLIQELDPEAGDL